MAEDLQPPARLIAWCSRALRLVTEDGVANTIVLHAERSGEHSRKLASWSLAGDREFEHAELAQELYSTAVNEADAQVEPGALRFTALVLDNTGRDHVDSHSWLIQSRSLSPPHRTDGLQRIDDRQALGVMARSFQQATQTLLDSIGPMLEHQTQENKRLAAQVAQMADQQCTFLEMMQRLQMARRAEDIEIEKSLMSARRQDQLVGMAVSLAPHIFSNAAPNSNAAKAMQDHGMDPQRLAVADLQRNLSHEELMKIAQHLTPQNQQRFMQVAKTASEDLQRLDQHRPKPLQDPTPTDEQVAQAADQHLNGN